MRWETTTAGRRGPDHGPVPSRPVIRRGIALRVTLLMCAVFLGGAAPVLAQDPAHTATLYVDGFDPGGATRHGTFGVDRRTPLIDSVAALVGCSVAEGGASLPANVVATTWYYGDAAPSYYSSADVTALQQVTGQWGGGVPRYALIVAKYARNVLQRSGARQINLISGSFGSLIVRWIIEKDVEGLASEGRIARWLSIEGVLAGNWAASRDDLVHYLDFLDPLPIDVAHMRYDWVGAQLHAPRTEADSPHYAGILLGQIVSTDDGYNGGALSALMSSYGEYQPNDGVQAVADARFQSVTAASQLAGLPPTLSWFHDDHLSLKHDRTAWAQAAAFITQRRRVTVTMTSARVADLHEAHTWLWDWRPAEVVLESRVYSPAIFTRWGVGGPVSTIEKEGAIAPLRRYRSDGETQTFSHVIFDDLVLDEETTLQIGLHAEEIDYDWRYGVYETAQTPYYDDLGFTTLSVSTLTPGTYGFQAASWSGTVTVSIHDYPFASSVGVGNSPARDQAPRLDLSPNPHSSAVWVRVSGLGSSLSSSGTLEIYDLEGRRIRRITGDARIGFRWDGRDDAGAKLPPGIYLHRVTTPAGSWSGRSIVIR